MLRIGHWGHRDQGAGIGTLGWILVVASAWLAAATVVGLLVGRMIRERDRQVPPAAIPASEVPDDPAQRVGSRGRQRRP